MIGDIFSVMFICFLSLFAYLNMYREATKMMDTNVINNVVIESLQGFSKLNIISVSVCGTLFFCFGLLENMYRTNSLFLLIASAAILVAFIIRGLCYWQRIIRLI